MKKKSSQTMAKLRLDILSHTLCSSISIAVLLSPSHYILLLVSPYPSFYLNPSIYVSFYLYLSVLISQSLYISVFLSLSLSFYLLLYLLLANCSHKPREFLFKGSGSRSRCRRRKRCLVTISFFVVQVWQTFFQQQKLTTYFTQNCR